MYFWKLHCLYLFACVIFHIYCFLHSSDCHLCAKWLVKINQSELFIKLWPLYEEYKRSNSYAFLHDDNRHATYTICLWETTIISQTQENKNIGHLNFLNMTNPEIFPATVWHHITTVPAVRIYTTHKFAEVNFIPALLLNAFRWYLHEVQWGNQVNLLASHVNERIFSNVQEIITTNAAPLHRICF